MTADQLRPTGDRILVRPDPREKISAGGLEIPDSVLAENPNYFSMTGVVVRLGDGLRDDTYRCTSCQVEGPRTKMDRCPICSALMLLHEAGDHHAFDVRVGERVLFNRFAGKQVECAEPDPLLLAFGVMESKSVRYLMMHESEVLGIVDGEHRILPGYEAAKWGKATDGTTGATGRITL